MGNEVKLSEMLKDPRAGTLSWMLEKAGFVCILGYTETCGGIQYRVGHGMPRSYDRYYDVVVVFNESGEPNIKEDPEHKFDPRDFYLHGSRHGAHVPFVNSGGPEERRRAIAMAKAGVR